MADRRDERLAAILRNGWPGPRPGWEARALTAMAAVCPRRHPNLVTVVVVTLILLLLAVAAFAAVRYFFVEGTLRFRDVHWTGIPGSEDGLPHRFLSGELEWSTELPEDASISPIQGERDLVYSIRDRWPPTWSDIVRGTGGPDGVNLTDIAGVGGVNCQPRWSPDGTMIAFQHCDPVERVLHCRAGFHLWVMNADGSGAHRVMAQGIRNSQIGSWSPDGSRLLSWTGEWIGSGVQGEQAVVFSTDIWGTHIQVLPNVGGGASWSPDGRMIISADRKEAEVDGRDGWWNRLVLTKADGSDPRVLVEQFIAEADIRAGYPTEHQLALVEDADYWVADVRHWAGPCCPVWSPSGDMVAFLAALPWDPDGPWYIDQIEVWVYDLATDELIRVTNDDVGQSYLSWK